MTEHASGTHAHPTVGQYLSIAAVLTMLTVVEVAIFYIPAFHPVLVPALLSLSAIKFALVVMFYMHLKADHKLFSFVFTGPLLLATCVIIALLFLFGRLVLG
jgi:cytochrome c oxidase subunit 4